MGGGQYLGLRGNALQIAIGVIAGMDFLLLGCDQGVTGGLLNLESFISVFPSIATTGAEYEQLSSPARSARSTEQGIVVAAYNLGCFAGSIPTIWIGNWLGRRKTIFIGSFIMVIGAILQCTAYHLPQLIVGRIVTGLGMSPASSYRLPQTRLLPLILRRSTIFRHSTFLADPFGTVKGHWFRAVC